MFEKEKNSFGELYDRGVLFQLNAGSILGLYGKHAKENAKVLLKNDMVHFIASDNHKKDGIYSTYLAKALKKIEKIIGKERLYELTEINPKKVIYNEDLIN